MFTKSDVKDAYPLTPMQEGILYHYLMGSRGSDHFKQISYRITGEFNPERFQEAFNILIERHDILRTVFIFEKVKKSLQVVLKQRTSTIYFQDLTHLPGEQPERYIKEFKEKDKEKGFDLSKDILLRYSILQVSPIAYEIIILLHHIIIDGWSTGMLILEMTNIYRLLRDGKPVKLPRVTPYSTYIKWLEKQDNQAGLNHWKLYLKNYENQAVIPKIKVSKDYRYRQDQHTFGIGKILTGSLNRLAKENKTTTNTAFQAAWGLLLQKYNNSSDVVFGGVVSGRPAEIPGIEKMIGMFINTLPVRIQTGNAVNFIQLLGRVRTESIPCRKYEYVPLVEVQALTGLKQELLSHIIAFDNFPVEKGLEESSDGSKPDFSVGQTQLFEQTNYGIVVTVVPGGELKLIIRYNVEAYDAPHMKRLEGHFIRILQQVTQAPEAPLKQLKILSPGEERQLLVHFNDTEASYPNGKTIHRLFEEQVDRSLDNTAVLFQEQRLTYKELEEESNRLAAFLREKGVSTGSIVGLMLERSPRMIIGIFAILKAGGAYLPISPDYPRERVEYILADSNTSLLLTQKKWDNELEYSDEIIELDEKKNYPGTGKRLSIPNESTDPAYVIYTSGTTGKPKGTVIQHFSLVNRICWMQNKYLISTSDTILQKTPFTFDVSVWEMFWWAVYGAAVCFLVPGGEKEPAAIVEAIWKNRITVMHFVPSMLSAFLEYIDSFRQVEKISLLRQVFASGEALSLTQVQNFNRLLYQTNSTRLANLYGPTEATIDVTYFDCSTGEEFDKIPIGKPIDNMRLYILDKRKEILPVGIPGELYIAGDGLSRGYLNNPELTAEKLIPNPFVSSLSKSQYPITTNYLYCTGDLARWLPDGNIEFLGRIDNQVKMRGFRIEPGEIENLLLTHEGVKEAVVSVIEAEEDSKYLCAYIVPAKELSTSQLTAHLATGLPEYMIPRDFVSLEKIPLTPNGKINRKALPLPEKKMGTSYSAPTNETEETLSQIWKAILNLEKVGIRDKFFSIGGDSIKAIRLISRLNGHFNADLKVADLYHAQTIEGLAQKISLGDFSHTAEEINAALQEIKEVQEKVTALDIKVLDIETVEAIYPMSDIEKGMVYYAMKNRMLYYYQDVFPVNLPKFEPGTLKKALQTMAVKHPALRTAFLPGESAHIIFKKIPIHLYYVDISRMEKTQQGENIKMYLKKNRETPLQEEISPLWRMSVFNTGNDVIVLAWEFHHAIMDGWSVNSFLVELLNTYFALSSNPVFVPSKLKCTFKNFIVEHLIEKKKNENILYWQKELEDYQRLDFPKIPGNSSAGEFKHFVIHLGAAPVERLESIAWKYNTNLKHLCFAAYVYMLNMLSYENDLVVGLTSHNRPAVEDGDKLIGCFLNTIPVRIKIPPLITWGDYIRLVEEKMVEIKNYEGLSFVEIANATGEGIRNRTPITDNLFNFVDFFIREQLTRGELQQIKDDSRQFERYGFSNVSFGFTVNATKSVIMLMLDCFTSVLAEEQVHKLVKYFETILIKFIEEPDGAIGKAKIISIEEKQKLLYHWNNTASEYPKSRTIHGLFIEQVQKTPDTVCVVDENKQITYRQLNKEVQRISILLKTKGVGPGTITAVLIERSIELIVGLLGILNTGGTYLPLTPDYPAERTEYMLRDSNAKILLTSRSLAKKSVYIKDTIYLDQLKKYSKQKKALPSSLIHNSLDLAYVIYTSGSTGRPKGVLVRQGGLVNLVYQYRKVFKQDRRDYLSQVASPGFDAMAFEVWPCLLQGSTLHIVKDDVRMAPTQLKQWLLQKNITISFQSTAIGQQLLEKNWPEKRVALRALLVAGDQLLEYPGRSYPFRFYNLYGPTEDTVWTTYTVVCKIPKKDATGYPSIGKPIGNHRVYILAADMSPQPVEIAGELCISGDGVAAGYLNRPELTSEKFVLNPIIENPKSHNSTIIANTILYKTGDLARYLPDGNIEFLGRIDNQVKIRGFRIELGEIENQLLKFEEIKENIVLAKTDHMGEKYLCAYIVPAAGVENSIAFNSELREKLSGILPDYMIPTYFVQLNKIPLTPNGKVDRKVLPEPEFSETAKGKSYSAPGNEIEEKVAEIWADILRIEKTIISIDANFFQLGGHSIKATILASKIHKEFDSQMPLAEIFKTPTIRGIARYIKESVKEKHASIEPVEKKEYYAVSSPQKRLYILQQMEIGNTGYNMPGTIRPEEKTDMEKLEIIFKELVARHESLRTSFHIVDDHPVQVVHDKIDFKIDNYKTTEKEAETIINRFTRPFDLSRAPLLRVALVEIERSHRQALLIDMHHIITDGTSQEILGNEFTALYAGTPLPPITLQYKDYSEWLNRKEQQQVVKQQEGYWISQFSGELPVLNLPLDYSRPVIQSFEGASVSFVLTGSETRTLKRIARELDATLYMVILALYTLLLSKLSGQEDIITGTPIAARRHTDLQNIIGMFVNTLGMRNFPVGGKRFDEFLVELKERVLGAFENQEYQFEDLVEKVSVQRNPGRNPVFDVMFNLLNQSETGTEGSPPPANGEPDSYEHIKRSSKFDLNLTAKERSTTVFFNFQYSTKLFSPPTIDRFIRYFRNTILQLTESTGIRLEEIDILPEKEKENILVMSRGIKEPYHGTTIHRLFEEKAKRVPQHSALIFNGSHLSYAELNRRANQVAALLKQKGAGSDSIVGLTVNRSFEMIIGMLGIIKAGAAYLPVDPEYPEERKKIMLEDSRTKILLTDSESETAGTAYIHRDVDVINLKEKGLYHGSGDTPNLSGHSGHMVYIMYTSGSTGKPKGVMLEHRNVANLIHYQLKHTNIDFARVLQFTTISFDVSFQEIATTLAAGGQLFLIEKEIRNNIPGLFGLIEKQRIRTLFLPASYLKFVLGQEDYISLLPADVRHIVTAGEQLVVPDAFREYLRTRNVWLHNHYGPSETHVVTALSMSPEGPHPELPSIGRPILNTGIYILDKTKKLQVTGAPGELAIGGIQVGRGYWLNETWTRETFIANPFAPGERLYCSGDLARWLPDGNIQFLGRIDQQVKIRGFRVEPGEIENHLLNIEHIKECAVLVKNSENGEPHLCAYIVAATGVAVSRLRELLARHLPEYMIPTAFTFVETIPLTPNGKIDRKALPQPEIKLQKEYVAPRNQTEVRLLRLWSEVLKVRAELIGIDTDFFLLGGHSLKATILLSKIHKEFSIALSLGEMFQATTIRKLAGCIRDAVKKEYAAIEPAEKKEYYSASSPQKRLYILQQMEVGNTGYNMPYNILPQEKIDKNKLEIVFRKLIVRHESLRTSFHIINDRPVQKIHYKTNFKIDYYKITENEAETIINEFKRPFNLSQAPLLRVALLEIESSHHQALLIDMHHIITDGTSQDILGKEFAALYAGEQLPLIKLQYRDYSEWQNLKEQQEWVKGQEHYWINRFSDELPVLNLPNDYPRPVIQSFEGAVVSFVLNVPESRALKHIARESDATLYMIILALYTVLLSKLSGQEDIIVGTPIAARRHADLQNIIGMFVNTLAMRNYPAAARTFKEFLIELKGRVLKAFENQEYQFEDLVEKISITRDTGRNPLFDIMFNLLNITTSGSEILPHRENSGLQHIEAASKFDMTLTASEYSGAISFRLLYAVTLFKKETIDRIIVYLKKILKTVTSNPDIKIDVIDIIPETIKNEILTHFNQNLEDSFVLKPLQDKLFESFDKFCDCIAIRYGKSELSYRKLERNAVSISNWIIRKKFPKGSYFGIFMENRIDVVSVMIGILNAGCVFVPMDTSLPLKRLQAMLQVTGTGLIFTDVRNNEKLVEIADDNEPVNRTRIQSIIIDTTFYSANRPSATMKRTVDVHLDDSVYIYFTSGTTGTPKAITGINKSLLQFILWEIEMFEIAPSFRISQLTALGFDAFLRDVFTTLCAGGTVCIPDNREMILESEKIVKWIDMNGISLIHCVPSVFRVFNTSWLTSANFGRLKYILLSGEALNPYELVDWQKVFGERIHLVNLYGPTETTMVCTNYFISHHDLNSSSIPIGNPIRGVRLIRLDKGLNVCAHDQVGEIYIRTPYSTAGYCNEPRATGEKFIPNPFLQKNGDVIYRTGDLAREAEDGNIHLLGRIDRQVKIRGVRIELVDIEASLIALPGIKGAVALLKQYKDEKYLCAYYVESRPTHPKSNPQHPASDIHHPATNFRELLAQTLPTYMLPDFFIKIDSIPLTPNGKIDKKALSKFQISDFKSQTFIAPRNETEEKLADLWADVLNLDKSVIGIDSDFFQLGGHSLKATILVSKIHRKLNMLISLAEFFQAPTIRRLAQNFETEEKAVSSTKDKHIIQLRSGTDKNKHLFFIHDGTGEVEGYLELCKHLHKSFNCWGLKADRLQKGAPGNITIPDIAGTYISRIKKIQPRGPYSIVGWSLGGVVAFEIVRELEQLGEETGFFAMVDSRFRGEKAGKRDREPWEFSIQTELELIRKSFPEIDMDKMERLKETPDLEQLWAFVIRYIESEIDIRQIRKLVSTQLFRGLRNYDNMTAEELVNYYNLLRTLVRADSFYRSPNKIDTQMYYFAALQSKGTKRKQWKTYCTKPVKYFEIPGDHFSIFQQPGVRELAKVFNRILVSTE